MMTKTLNRKVDRRIGFSFADFLNYIEMTDVTRCNIHHRQQFNSIESYVKDKTVINIDAVDLDSSLREFEQRLGLKWNDRHQQLYQATMATIAPRHWVHRFETDEDFSERVLRTSDARRRWPGDRAFLNSKTRADIKRIYNKDFIVYSDYL